MDLRSNKSSLLNDRSESIKGYIKDIYKCESLTHEQQIELYNRAQDGDAKAREELIVSNQRFVFAIAKRYTSEKNIMDIVEEGNIGLMEAIDSKDPKFDPSKGYTFLTFAVWFIRRRIVNYMINNNFIVKKTNNAKTNFHIGKIKSKFYCENGRYPTNDEIVELFDKEYGIKIIDSNDLCELKTDSINTTFDNDDSNAFENSHLFTSKTANYNDYIDKVEKESSNYLVNTALSYFNDRDKTILKMAYGIGYDKEYKNFEIANEIGLTTERVRQLKKEAVKRLESIIKDVAGKEHYLYK